MLVVVVMATRSGRVKIIAMVLFHLAASVLRPRRKRRFYHPEDKRQEEDYFHRGNERLYREESVCSSDDGVDHGRRQRVGRVPEQEKAQSLREETLEFLLKDSTRKMIQSRFFTDCIAEDFNVQLEDESHEEVGKVLRAMFEECERRVEFSEKIEMQKLSRKRWS